MIVNYCEKTNLKRKKFHTQNVILLDCATKNAMFYTGWVM